MSRTLPKLTSKVQNLSFFTPSLGFCVSTGDAVAARIPAALTKIIPPVCAILSSSALAGRGQLPHSLLSQKLVKHAIGYMGDISQVNTHSNTHRGRLQRSVRGESEERQNWGENLTTCVQTNKQFLPLSVSLSVFQ